MQRRHGVTKKLTHLYVPANFDPEQVLPDSLKRHADVARYFLHRIIWGRVQKRTTPDGFVPLKWDYLRPVIPDRVLKPLKQALIDADVIECDGQYIEGHKSFGYRLGSPYRDAPFVRAVVAHAQTATRIQENRRCEKKKIRLDVHRYLRRQFQKLEIDREGALAALAGHPNHQIVKIPVEQIAAKDFSFSVCRYGRVHTDLTRAAKPVRRSLHVGGEPLVSVDITNSQPLFFALLLINFRIHGNKTHSLISYDTAINNQYDRIDRILSSFITRTTTANNTHEQHNSTSLPQHTITHHHTTVHSITTRKSALEFAQVTATSGVAHELRLSRSADCLKEDERRFVVLCETGRLYEELMVITDTPVRKWVKEGFFEILFGRNAANSDFKRAFTEAFPSVADVARRHKRKDHSFLARLLQNYESTFIINRVCRRLMHEHPTAPIFTIHDSVLTIPAYQDSVVSVIREEFAKLGLSPSLHVEQYGSPRRNRENDAG